MQEFAHTRPHHRCTWRAVFCPVIGFGFDIGDIGESAWIEAVLPVSASNVSTKALSVVFPTSAKRTSAAYFERLTVCLIECDNILRLLGDKRAGLSRTTTLSRIRGREKSQGKQESGIGISDSLKP